MTRRRRRQPPAAGACGGGEMTAKASRIRTMRTDAQREWRLGQRCPGCAVQAATVLLQP